MSKIKIPIDLKNTIEVQEKWLNILQLAQDTVEEDAALQHLVAKGVRLKERSLPPELVGRNYARYCDLVNKMYDAYLNSVHLQRAPYIQEIITVIVKRMYELRNELVHIIVNDYIYVDPALAQLHLTPSDIEIVVPYHFPLESRPENVEKILQQMWADAAQRKKERETPEEPNRPRALSTNRRSVILGTEDFWKKNKSPPSSGHAFSEEFMQSLIIQRHERFRQWRMRDVRAKAAQRKAYFLETAAERPLELKTRASDVIQMVYREFMKVKRERVKDAKRDMMLGLIPDPFRSGPSFIEENNKVYERRRNTRMKMKKTYLEELEKENTRLILLRKGDQIDDITDEIRTWFKEWFYGYNYFPEFPYETEGGTLLVVRGDYPTVEEKKEQDEKLLTQLKTRTKEQLKEDRARAKAEAKQKAKAAKDAKRKQEMALMKNRCNPLTDPGYLMQESTVMAEVIEAIRNYRLSWSLFDELPPDRYGEAIYGYMKPLLTEELMKEIHIDCRKFVDEMMRLDLKMLIQKHQLDFKNLGWKYPAVKPRKKPKIPRNPVPLILDETLLNKTERVFDLGIVSKPTTKLSDVYGDSSYAAYDYNIRDPNASGPEFGTLTALSVAAIKSTCVQLLGHAGHDVRWAIVWAVPHKQLRFPLPGFGDIKGRLTLSCVLGCGIQPGAPRRKAVMLLGPERNGKSFLADVVAGELNAIKIDITPEVFSAVVARPLKVLNQVFLAARAFQPAVIFMKNVERVFTIKVPPEEKFLQAQTLKGALVSLVKQIPTDDKVIFIGTCTNPWVARAKPMVNMFDEILLVPRTDYGTLQQFFYQKLQSVRSIPRDYPVQPIAQLLQGYGFGDIINAYNEVMSPERIVRLNVQQLSPGEFLEVLLRKGLEPLTLEDYQKYVDFFINNSPLKTEREAYETINFFRDDMYKKMAKKEKMAEKNKKMSIL